MPTDYDSPVQVCQACGSVSETATDGRPCESCLEETDDDSGPCCIAFVTSGGSDHIPGCES